MMTNESTDVIEPGCFFCSPRTIGDAMEPNQLLSTQMTNNALKIWISLAEVTINKKSM